MQAVKFELRTGLILSALIHVAVCGPVLFWSGAKFRLNDVSSGVGSVQIVEISVLSSSQNTIQNTRSRVKIDRHNLLESKGDLKTQLAADSTSDGAGDASTELPAPDYPLASREMGEEGLVILRAFFNESRIVSRVELISGSGFSRLDEAAKKAVLGISNTKTHSTHSQVFKIHFKLE